MSLVAEFHIAVDYSSGDDGTGAGDADEATAKTLPYKTLAAAMAVVNPASNARAEIIHMSNSVAHAVTGAINTSGKNGSYVYPLIIVPWDNGGAITVEDGFGRVSDGFEIDLGGGSYTLFSTAMNGFAFIGGRVKNNAGDNWLIQFGSQSRLINSELTGTKKGAFVPQHTENCYFHDIGTSNVGNYDTVTALGLQRDAATCVNNRFERVGTGSYSQYVTTVYLGDQYGNNQIISGNIFKACNIAIDFDRTNSTTISNNTFIKGNGYYALRMGASTLVAATCIQKNLFVDYTSDNTIIYKDTSSGSHTKVVNFTDNAIYNCHSIPSGVAYVSYGNLTLASDPFVDVDENDLHLLSTSEAYTSVSPGYIGARFPHIGGGGGGGGAFAFASMG